MTGRAFGWWLLASVGVHVAGLSVALPHVSSADSPRPLDPVAVEVVREPAPPEPAPVKPPERRKVTPPRLASTPTAVSPTPPAPAPLTQETPPRESVHRFLAAANSSGWSIPGAGLDAAPGAGKLFATGDLPVAGHGQPSGAAGVDGARLASKDEGEGLTSFARPLGGYQTKPHYPESARRQGIEGITLLRFQVLATGRVAGIAVTRSAGYAELDRAAAEAVKTWLFEPARRGKEAVAVWVTLPVRFTLQLE